MSERLLTPAEMAEAVDVSIDTLRYYERERLISGVERADNGHRRYDADDVAWIRVLRCLRDTGMTIDQLRHYCDLGEQGPSTKPERLALLRAHRAKVEERKAELDRALELIDHKIDVYVNEGMAAPKGEQR